MRKHERSHTVHNEAGSLVSEVRALGWDPASVAGIAVMVVLFFYRRGGDSQNKELRREMTQHLKAELKAARAKLETFEAST